MNEDIRQKLLDNTDKEVSGITTVYSVDDIDIKEIGDSIFIYINKDLYDLFRDKVNSLLLEYIINYKKDTIVITSGELINEELIKALCENENIKIISLAKYNTISKYSLSKEHFDQFKKANKESIRTSYVDEELKEVYDPMIEYNYEKKMFSYYSYKDFHQDKIRFYSEISEKDLQTLQYLGDNTEITISTSCNIKDIIETLRKYNKKNIVKIEVFSKDKLSEELSALGCFKNDYSSVDDNIFLNLYTINREYISLKDYVGYEKLLQSIAEPAKNLSPYEKLIYAYDITKKFKKYNTPKKDNKNASKLPYEEKARLRGMSRDLYSILDNDYIVCVGFANLLGDLLTRLGLDNIAQSVEIDLARHKAIKQLIAITPNWKQLTPEEKHELISKQLTYIPKTAYEGHRRVMVRIKDDKYGIDGLYSSDPTWDNDLERNSYAHMTMTENDVSNSMSTVAVNNDFLLFSATSIDEFYQMINQILDNKKRSKLKRYEEEEQKRGKKATQRLIAQDEISNFQQVILNFFKKVKKLFPKEYNSIKEKYPTLSDESLPLDSIYNLPPDITNILYEIGKLIVSKNNNSISDGTLRQAISEVYKDVYEGGLNHEELDKMMKDTDLYREVEFSSTK